MGKGERAHVDYTPPLSSSDIIPSKGKATDSPVIFQPSTKPQEFDANVEKVPLIHLITTYLSYLILIVIGHCRDFVYKRTHPELYYHLNEVNGYAPIATGFDTFYHRNLYTRLSDTFNRPTTGVPGRTVKVLERTSNDGNKTYQLSGKIREHLNLSSYNYLGFGENDGPCSDQVEQAVRKNGISTGSSAMETGTHDMLIETEQLVARFMGQEDAVVFSMGFATNSTVIPALAGKGDLLISDELNHSSLVFGARISGATVKVFKHNDPKDLEIILREAISQGQNRTHRPWKKIVLVLEGLYSMEGNICKLDCFVELKKKYKAHSVGALGPNGRGICDYYGIDPCDVDILMGTFTKSFGAAGGYIAGNKQLIDSLRLRSHSSVYCEPMSVPVLKQVYSSMRMIMGEDFGQEGRHRIQALARNSRYFCNELRKMGFIVYGNDSPVIPLLLMNPAKIAAFSREMLERGIAVVVVGYPATPIITSRVRFCISAAHTMEDLTWALEEISIIGDRLLLKMAN